LGMSTCFVKTILPFSRGHFRSTFSICSHKSIVCLTKVITPHLTSTLTKAPSVMVSWKVPDAVMVRVSPLMAKYSVSEIVLQGPEGPVCLVTHG
jgi:hypothetical protein